MSDIEFIGGLVVKAPKDGTPDYVKLKLSIKREELIAWLQSKDGEWINAEVKESRGGKLYCAVDSWKPDKERSQPAQPRQAPAQSNDSFEDDPLPF